MKDTEKLHEAILRLDSSVNLLSTSTSRLASAAFHLLDKQREMVVEQAKPIEACEPGTLVMCASLLGPGAQCPRVCKDGCMYAKQEAQRAHRAQAVEDGWVSAYDHKTALIHALRDVNSDELDEFIDVWRRSTVKSNRDAMRIALSAFLAKRRAS